MKLFSFLNKSLIICGLIILLNIKINAQTIEGYKAQYGQPISSQFMVLPGIIMNVYMSESGEICKVIIKQTEQIRIDEDIMDDELANKIIDDVIPKEMRGAYVNSGNAEFGKPCILFDFYEHVVISKQGFWSKEGFLSETLKYKVREIEINWKDTKCICDEHSLYQTKPNRE